MLVSVPERYQDEQQRWWAWFEAACKEQGVVIPLPGKWQALTSWVWLASEFVRQYCLERPQLLVQLVESGDLFRSCSKSYFYYHYRQVLKSSHSISQLKIHARSFRCQMMMRLIWRDIAGCSGLYETIKETSLCADAIIDLTSKWLFRWYSRQWGVTPVYQGRPSYLMVLAVGKLGGMELNFSSDVDLIFCYMSCHGGSEQDDKVNEFYQFLARQLIAMLHNQGLLYRVDMRLRPFGSSGPLVMGSSQLLRYYRDHARDWERYAMLKTRVISGDPRAARELQAMVDGFVYRPYLDYATVESLRKLHGLWRQEAKKRNMKNNIKMGVGGIREIEFIVQNIQLTRGGQEPRLRQSNLLSTLSVIEQECLLPAHTVAELEKAYVFFRSLENRLQAYDDAQTHALPYDNIKRDRIALTLGYHDWQGLVQHTDAMRAMTHANFKRLVFRPELYEYTMNDKKFMRCLDRSWSGQVQHADLVLYLHSLGFDMPEEMVNWLCRVKTSKAFGALDKVGREHFNQLILLTLITVSRLDTSCYTLRRVLPILTVVIERKAYLVLLIEHPNAHGKLVRLSYVSAWLAEQITSYPALLGELIDEHRLYEAMSLSSLKRKLLTWLQATSEASEEDQMRVVQHFKQLHVFRVAAMDAMGKLAIAQVSNYLTFIAEAILAHVNRLAWRRLSAVHGRLRSARRAPKLLIIAYGKLGGFELGYGSDLDLVFLYHRSDQHDTACTDGIEPVNETTFYTRLAQKILQLMGHQTLFGPLYVVDTRLRPMGDSGLLLSSLKAFAVYQTEQAWVWEHQALVRARVVVGPPDLRAKFYAIRKGILSMPREPHALWQSVCDMRQKMHVAAKSVPCHLVNVKESRGCINDVEFLVQYYVLAFSEKNALLTTFTDNIRLLEVMGRLGLISMVEVQVLRGAFLAYRLMVHKLDLQKRSEHNVPETKLRAYRSAVCRVWQTLSMDHTDV